MYLRAGGVPTRHTDTDRTAYTRGTHSREHTLYFIRTEWPRASQKGEGEQEGAFGRWHPSVASFAGWDFLIGQVHEMKGELSYAFSIAHIEILLLDYSYETHTGNHFSVSYRSLLLPLRWRSCPVNWHTVYTTHPRIHYLPPKPHPDSMLGC